MHEHCHPKPSYIFLVRHSNCATVRNGKSINVDITLNTIEND